jgi:hypothetical protein
MRKQIESWRGAKFTDPEAELFDVRKLAGQTCLLQVVHTDDGQYANVANIMAPPKGTAKLKPEGAAIYYGPDDDKQYDDLPKFLREKVDMQLDPATATGSQKPAPTATTTSKASGRGTDAEADAIAAQQAAKDDFGDEIPF